MNDYQTISTPICDFVRDYAVSGISRFHMPGHKGAPVLPGLSMQADITEIRGADCLYEAAGIILESEQNATALFGTGATFYSTEGSSQCIRAMLTLATRFAPVHSLQMPADAADPTLFPVNRPKNPATPRTSFGQKSAPPGTSNPSSDRHISSPVILAARNVHRSFLTAAALLDLDVEWLYPESDSAESDLPRSGRPDSICSCPVTAEQIRRTLDEMDRLPVAVYLTSPDYLGYMQDIAAISEAVHKYGIPLLVDNAHGAYLHFLEQPVHPMDLGADLCCDSAHKTLPALTGCAYLHISKKAASVYAAHARKSLSLFGSTSPSWLLLQSLDQTNAVLAGDFRKNLSACANAVRKLKDSFREPDIKNYPNPSRHVSLIADTQEPLKITLNAAAVSRQGEELADYLRMHHIECEYADAEHVVLMVSPYNTAEDMARLEETLVNIASGLHSYGADSCMPESACFPADPARRKMSIREAALSPSLRLPTEQATGHVSADLSLACPPGIPIVVCGEVITKEAVALLKHYGIDQIDVVSR